MMSPPSAPRRDGPPNRRDGAPPERSDPPSHGLWGGWLIPMALVLAVNLATHLVPDGGRPLRQLAFYLVVMASLLVWERLRHTLPRAQVVVLLLAGLVVGVTHREALLARRLAPGDALGEAVRMATGLGPGVAGALRVGALGDPAAAPYLRYVDRVDSRASDIVILASHLAEGCESADHLCESASLLRFVADEIAYRSDPRGGDDYVKSPQETLAAGAGDCEDKTILLTSLLESLGNRTYLVFTRDHVWPLVCFDAPLPEQWRQRTSRLSPGGQQAYAQRLGGRDRAGTAPDELGRRFEAAEEIEIDDRACYAMEPTAAGSWFGVHHEARGYLVAVDPVTRKAIDLSRIGLPVTR